MTDLETEVCIIWHEHNKSGAPEHVFGSHVVEGCIEDSMDKARAWIEDCIIEDMRRPKNDESTITIGYGTGADGELYATTETDNQTTYYSIVVNVKESRDE